MAQTLRNRRNTHVNPSGLGGQHHASVGTSTIHETRAQWQARINWARQQDGLKPYSDAELAALEAFEAERVALAGAEDVPW